MPKSHRRSMDILPRKGRMGSVIAIMEQQKGLTREGIRRACVECNLQGGSIDRMILYAKKCNLLLTDGTVLFTPPDAVSGDTASAPAQEQVPSLRIMGATAEQGGDPPPVVEMRPPALVFLSDPLARQLAVAWQACNGNEAEWLSTAGIKPYFRGEAMELCIALRRNNICRDGGITDTLAMRYITTVASEPLLKQGRRHDKSS